MQLSGNQEDTGAVMTRRQLWIFITYCLHDTDTWKDKRDSYDRWQFNFSQILIATTGKMVLRFNVSVVSVLGKGISFPKISIIIYIFIYIIYYIYKYINNNTNFWEWDTLPKNWNNWNIETQDHLSCCGYQNLAKIKLSSVITVTFVFPSICIMQAICNENS